MLKWMSAISVPKKILSPSESLGTLPLLSLFLSALWSLNTHQHISFRTAYSNLGFYITEFKTLPCSFSKSVKFLLTTWPGYDLTLYTNFLSRRDSSSLNHVILAGLAFLPIPSALLKQNKAKQNRTLDYIPKASHQSLSLYLVTSSFCG